MVKGDLLASGAKKASFTTREGRKMTQEEWDKMWEPDAEPQPEVPEEKHEKETQRI